MPVRGSIREYVSAASEIASRRNGADCAYSDQWGDMVVLPNAPHVFASRRRPFLYFPLPFLYLIRSTYTHTRARARPHTHTHIRTRTDPHISARVNRASSFRRAATLGKIHAIKRHTFAALVTFPFARAGQLPSPTVTAVNSVAEVLRLGCVYALCVYCMCVCVCIRRASFVRARSRARKMSD